LENADKKAGNGFSETLQARDGKRDAVMLLSFAITSSIAVMAAQKVFEALQS
jgi:hypothetical protein